MGEFTAQRWVESGRGRVTLLQPKMLAALVRRNEPTDAGNQGKRA